MIQISLFVTFIMNVTNMGLQMASSLLVDVVFSWPILINIYLQLHINKNNS